MLHQQHLQVSWASSLLRQDTLRERPLFPYTQGELHRSSGGLQEISRVSMTIVSGEATPTGKPEIICRYSGKPGVFSIPASLPDHQTGRSSRGNVHGGAIQPPMTMYRGNPTVLLFATRVAYFG